MTTEAEETHIDPVGPIAGSDEVTDAEYEAWQKGEELAEGSSEDSAEPFVEVTPEQDAGLEPVAEEEPAGEEEAEPAAAQEDEDDGTGMSRSLKRRLDKIREREAAALQREAAANARAAAAEALLAAQRAGAEESSAEGDPLPKDRVYTQAELDAEAKRIAAQQVAADKFNAKCDEVADIGQKAFGAKWAASLEALRDVGVISDDLSFLQDALETEAPEKVLFHLGQNPDEAERLLTLSPTRRAVALDRLAVQLSTEKPKAPKPVSKVPAPIAPVNGSRNRKELDINDPTLSDDEAISAWEAHDRRLAAGR